MVLFIFFTSTCFLILGGLLATFLQHPNLLSVLLCSLDVDHFGLTPLNLMLSVCAGFSQWETPAGYERTEEDIGLCLQHLHQLKAAFLLPAVPSMTSSVPESSSGPFPPCFFSPGGKLSSMSVSGCTASLSTFNCPHCSQV